jgi:glycosyltransferase involved in cell wall biosynthesis
MCKAPSVPPAPPAPCDERPLSVGFDATPLLGAPTGVGAFCAGALSGLAGRRDVEVSAFAVSWRRRRGIEALVPAAVATRQRPMPARPLQWSWRHGARVPVEWFVGRHDVVHGSNFVVPPTAHAARVVTVHDLTVVLFPELCDPPTLAFPGLLRRAVAEGAWVHTPSQFVADEVVAELGVDPERVRAVHHGIPRLADTGGPGPAPELPPGCRRYVLAVGTVEPRKDYPALVAAFEEVAAGDSEVALVIAGADGWAAASLSSAIEASPARGRIVRAGYLSPEALAGALRHAAVLAYPSRYEGFGLPPLQAMDIGVPVVATAAGAVPEVVGDAAVVVATGDVTALAAAIERVLAGGPDVDELVERGRDRAGRFTWSACAEGLRALYRDAARARSRAGPRR